MDRFDSRLPDQPARLPVRLAMGVGLAALASLSEAETQAVKAGQTAGRACCARCTSPAKRSALSGCTWPAARRTWRRFDHKPKLAEMHGQPMPESLTKGQQFAQLQGQTGVLRPAAPVQEFGQVGPEICELFPHLGSVVDDVCIVRSMTTERSTTTRRTCS